MHPCRVVGTVIALGGLLALPAFWPAPSEPVYAGKTVDQWLEAGYEDSAMALQEIGPSAGSYVLRKLAREDAQYGSGRWYRAIWSRLPGAMQTAFPRPSPANFDEVRACSSLLEIGPHLVPFLGKHLRDRNPAVRSACARALGLFRQRGYDTRRAASDLTLAVQDPNPSVRASALWALALPAPPSRGRP
jgi:hypothetical protein